MQERKISICICAGEASGDRLGGQLANALLKENPHIHLFGIGGKAMQQAGVKLLAHYQPLAVVGYWHTLISLPSILALRRKLITHCLTTMPQIFIGVDAPDFNLSISKAIKPHGIKTVQYVAPSVWMWRKNRLNSIRKMIDEVWCLLPFEKKIYTDFGIAAKYVGHPSAHIKFSSKTKVRHRLGISDKTKVIALLPGSRKHELKQHLPLFAKTINLLKQQDRIFMSVAVNDAAHAQIQTNLPEVQCESLEDVFAIADVAVVKSGTIVLEAAMAKIPLIVVYRLSFMAYLLVRWRKFKLPFFSLPNILSGYFVIPELLLDDATPEAIAIATERGLNDKKYQQFIYQRFEDLQQQLIHQEVSPATATFALLSC